MTDGKRNAYMDFLKGLAIVAVVAGHSLTDVAGGYLLCNVIYSFHMPLLMFISAYLEEQNRDKYESQEWKMLCKRAGGLLLPYVSWSILYEVMSGQLWAMDLKNFGLQLLGYTQTGLWFFPVLFGLKVMHYGYWLLQRKLRRGGLRSGLLPDMLLCALLEVIAVILAFVTRQPFVINMLSYAIPYFLAVIIVGHKELADVMESEWLAAGSMLVYLFLFPSFVFHDTNWTTQVLKIVLSVCVIVICCKAQKIWEQNRLHTVLCLFGKYSLAIYVMHGFFIDYVVYLDKLESAYLIAASSVLLAFTVAGVCTGIAWIIECSAWCRKVLFGK